MTDRDDFDRDRMRRDEDTYFAVVEHPPQAVGQAATAVMARIVDEPLHPRRTVADRRADVIRLLEEHPEYSDRRLSRIAVVSRELVTRIRRELIRQSKIPSRHALHRVGADGKHYTRLPRARSTP